MCRYVIKMSHSIRTALDDIIFSTNHCELNIHDQEVVSPMVYETIGRQLRVEELHVELCFLLRQFHFVDTVFHYEYFCYDGRHNKNEMQQIVLKVSVIQFLAHASNLRDQLLFSNMCQNNDIEMNAVRFFLNWTPQLPAETKNINP